MEQQSYPPITVYNVFAGFRSEKLKYRITPFRFEMSDGKVHKIVHIRQSHRERVGDHFHFHFVVRTDEDRYFNIVFDTGALVWRLIQEFDEELLFSP